MNNDEEKGNGKKGFGCNTGTGKKVKLGITGGTPGDVVDKAKKDAEKIKEMDPKAKIEISYQKDTDRTLVFIDCKIDPTKASEFCKKYKDLQYIVKEVEL